jgi:hypothetical protein
MPVTPAPPAAYASVLYARLVDLRDAVAGSWRGLGTGETRTLLAQVEARLSELEAGEPGTAWTPLDEVLWRTTGHGRARLDAAHASWLSTVLDAGKERDGE